MKKLILLLWPSFLCAVLASLLFYSIFDPYALRLQGTQLFHSQLEAYACFILAAWSFGSATIWFALLLQRPRSAVHGFGHLPVRPVQRARLRARRMYDLA